MDTLPIESVLPELIGALHGNDCAVLRAPTGAGKTTRVPPAILDAGLGGKGQVVVLEPRRIAARAAARRVSQERGGDVGHEVGFHVRFDRCATRATRVLYVTEGLFLRRVQEDPFLERVGAVVLDEFHERSLDADLALALVRRLQLEARPDLRLVVMSATLDTAEVSRFLGGCPVVESRGRLHPVEIRHAPPDERKPVHEAVARGVGLALEEGGGDVLAFLPGVGEIRRAREALGPLARQGDLLLVELYGDLPMDRQDEALRRAGRRKIVLATNVAETSVTVEGVGAVVDSGLARVLRFDAGVGLDRLELVRISRASAEQRSGRAGREMPGLCIRLWSAAEERGLSEREEAEVRRVDLAGAVLQLRALGERDLRTFPWFEPPSEAALARAEALLAHLGALDARGLTPLGRRMADIPVQPRIARLLLEGERLGSPRRAALAGALLSERDPLRRERGAPRRTESDVLERVLAVEALAAAAPPYLLRVRDELLGHLERPRGPEDALPRALLAGWPDRLARRRGEGGRRGVMVGGRGVALARESGVIDAELFLCIDVDAGRRGERAEALVRQASAVERGWLPEEALSTSVEVAFDPAREAVAAFRRTRFLDLVIEEAQAALPESDEVARVLAQAASADPRRALALDDPDTTAFLARVRSLREWLPELGLPAFDEEGLRARLPELCAGCRSFEDLRRLPLVERLRSGLTYLQQRALEREAPERIEVPSGSRVRLVYEPGRPPVLAARIQELFGLAETPRVAGGRVAVLVHLLAPSGRAQQVTDDLRSFWNEAYQTVRKELRVRYPRHAWPEDPWNAPPERRPKRRR